MAYRSADWPEIFSVGRSGRGWRSYEARVRTNGSDYVRSGLSLREAVDALDCLKRRLVSRPGRTVPVLENWERGAICKGRRP